MTKTTIKSERQSESNTRLYGRALVLARFVWIVLVISHLMLFTMSIPYWVAQLETTCDSASNPACAPAQLSPAAQATLPEIGLSPHGYALRQTAYGSIFALTFVAVALVIFWRKSDDWMPLLTSAVFVVFGTATFNSPLVALGANFPLLQIPVRFLNFLGIAGMVCLFYLFPDGRFAPRWMRWVLPFAVAREFANVFLQSTFVGRSVGLFALELGSVVFTQVYRYARASGLVQRQQIKWVVFGTSVALGGFAGVIVLVSMGSPTGQPPDTALSKVVGGMVLRAFLLLIPLSIAVAVLRYRLWDVDILINRTLVYIPLTAILAGLFAASITFSQKAFVAITGATSDAATVLTTLIVVAAFEPLKSGLQHLVDRRFKEAPDPTKKLEAYGDQVQAVVQVLQAEQSLRRLLDEVVTAFDAQGGAVYLERDGRMQLVQSRGNALSEYPISLPLETNGKKIGVISLGARKNGVEYTSRDRATLERIGNLVATAIALTERTNGARE